MKKIISALLVLSMTMMSFSQTKSLADEVFPGTKEVETEVETEVYKKIISNPETYSNDYGSPTYDEYKYKVLMTTQMLKLTNPNWDSYSIDTKLQIVGGVIFWFDCMFTKNILK
jgi:hypothetical protein